MPSQPSSVRPNHHPIAIATMKESSPALSSQAVRSMFASDGRKNAIPPQMQPRKREDTKKKTGKKRFSEVQW